MTRFSKRTRDWLKSVIRQREHLLKTGASKVPELPARLAIEELKRYLDAYSFNNDVNMARFLSRNKDKVSAILPGTGSTSFTRRRSEFRQLCSEARTILREPVKIEFDV